MSESKVDIGVLEEKKSWLLHPRFFPSKVGGKPAWLDLQNLPKPAELTCKRCQDPLVFLCQVYAPYDELSDCFHRSIFIFICRNGSCCHINDSENFLVLRSQLPRKNNFYSFDPAEENENEKFSIEQWSRLCQVCGTKAPSHCSKCKKTYYCSRNHQILDWQKGHKECCAEKKEASSLKSNDFIVTQAGKGLLFKEWELLVDEEDEEDATDVDTNQEMEKLQKMMQEKKAGTLSNVDEKELELYTQNVPEDKAFKRFNKRVARHPNQVLRYNRGGIPLWITGKSENNLTHVPNCEYCNGEREFEFQIMPQLLNYIDVGIDFNSIDWGVLAIYTCKKSCSDGPGYKNEIIIKQDLTQ